MSKPALPPISLSRAEAAEILDLIDPIIKALETLPYRAAKEAIDFADAIREHICEACPGGFGDFCEVCGMPIGNDEVAAYDSENSLSFCVACFRDDLTPDEAEAGDVDAADRAKVAALIREALAPFEGKPITADTSAEMTAAVMAVIAPPMPLADEAARAAVEGATPEEIAGMQEAIETFGCHAGDTFAAALVREAKAADESDGWITWGGGRCPVPSGTTTRARFRGGSEFLTATPQCWWWHHTGGVGDLVAYRIEKPAPAYENHREPGEFGEGATIAIDPYWPPHEAEEIQLLRQLKRGMLTPSHSATIATAQRLVDRGDAFKLDVDASKRGGYVLELSAHGNRRLEAAALIPADEAKNG